EKVLAHYEGTIKGKTFALWGLSFKPRTDDIRDAPSIEIIRELIANGAKLQASDPAAIEAMKRILPETNALSYHRKNLDALKGADGLIIVTEWNEFRNPDFNFIARELTDKTIFDGRNIYDPERMREYGFVYY